MICVHGSREVRHRHVNKKSASDPNATSDANSREQEDDDGENEQALPLFPWKGALKHTAALYHYKHITRNGETQATT